MYDDGDCRRALGLGISMYADSKEVNEGEKVEMLRWLGLPMMKRQKTRQPKR